MERVITTRGTGDPDAVECRARRRGARTLKRLFVSLCAVEAPEDGLTFLSESVHVEAIRQGQEYGGMRVRLMADPYGQTQQRHRMARITGAKRLTDASVRIICKAELVCQRS